MWAVHPVLPNEEAIKVCVPHFSLSLSLDSVSCIPVAANLIGEANTKSERSGPALAPHAPWASTLRRFSATTALWLALRLAASFCCSSHSLRCRGFMPSVGSYPPAGRIAGHVRVGSQGLRRPARLQTSAAARPACALSACRGPHYLVCARRKRPIAAAVTARGAALSGSQHFGRLCIPSTAARAPDRRSNRALQTRNVTYGSWLGLGLQWPVQHLPGRRLRLHGVQPPRRPRPRALRRRGRSHPPP